MSFIPKKKKSQSNCHFDMRTSLRALVLVVLKSYITIFSTTKYKNMTTLVEPKPNNLAPQLILAMHVSSKVKKKKKNAFILL